MTEATVGLSRKKKMLAITIGVVLLLIAAGVGTALAADAAIPGDALYPLDRQLEALQLRLSADPARIHQQLAEERLAEVQALAYRGDNARMPAAIADLNQELLSAGQAMAQSAAPAAGPTPGQKGKPDQPGKADENGKGQDEQPKEPRTNPLCSASEQEQPALQKLAEEMQVGYAEVLAWYCQGLGIGEIKLAYQISQQASVAVAQIVAQRLSGMGWGQIMQEYQLKGKGKPEKSKPNKKP